MNENIVTINGITYKAVPQESCEGCDLDDRCLYFSMVFCGAAARTNNTSVIWKRRTK